jgi:hypothetical protein
MPRLSAWRCFIVDCAVPAQRCRYGQRGQQRSKAGQCPPEPASPSVVVAMAVAALGYGIMNLLMIQASMHMKHMHEDFTDVAWRSSGM